MASITLPPISALTKALPPRLVRGRSRDVQAWESCAESDRKDELTAQAEYESNGSAIAAISLLRSASAVLQSSTAKRNLLLSRSQQQLHQSKRARFRRSTSMLSRLENIGGDAKTRQSVELKAKHAPCALATAESDKENVSPDEIGLRRNEVRRQPCSTRRLESARRPGQVLGEQRVPNLLASRAQTAPSRGREAVSMKAGGNTQGSRGRLGTSQEDEVERFMRGEISPSKKGDMDCVAGLLSLSQGAWR